MDVDDTHRLAAVEFVAVYLLSHHLSADPEALAQAQAATAQADLPSPAPSVVANLRRVLPGLNPYQVAVIGTDEAEALDRAVANLFRRAVTLVQTD